MQLVQTIYSKPQSYIKANKALQYSRQEFNPQCCVKLDKREPGIEYRDSVTPLDYGRHYALDAENMLLDGIPFG